MPTNLKPAVPESEDFALIPEDIYEASIHEIEDRERDVYMKPGEKEQVMRFTFRIAEGEYADTALYLNVKPTLFPGSKGLSPSKLYQILSAVNGKLLDETDLEGVDTESVNELIGKKLRLIVKHAQTENGQQRNKIDGFLLVK